MTRSDMFSQSDEIRSLEKRYGTPRLTAMRIRMMPSEYDVLRRIIHEGYGQDIAVLIVQKTRVATIQRDPEGIYRLPRWKISSLNTIEEVTKMKSLEKIGIQVELESYIVRSIVRFFSRTEESDWISHVFMVKPLKGKLEVQDGGELRRVRWASMRDVATTYRGIMLSSGSGEMKYLAYLTDVALKELQGVDGR